MEKDLVISDCQLMFGDCLERMKEIPNNSIDMILCDLPYGVLNKNNPCAQWDKPLPMEDIWRNYNRIIKDKGCVVLFAQGMFTAELMISNKKIWRYNWIWDKKLKTGFLNAKKMPLRQHEDICVFYKHLSIYNPQMHIGNRLHGKGNAYKIKANKNSNYGEYGNGSDSRKGSIDKFPSSIISICKDHPSISVHPTQKPVALLEYLIKTYTNEDMIVLDNCMGSGSTMVACIKTNRKGIGIEIDENYYQIACKRVEDALREPTLFK